MARLEENKLHTPQKGKRAKPVIGIDRFDADAIGRHVYGSDLRKEYPARKKLVQSLMEAGLFFGAESSFTKILNTVGFQVILALACLALDFLLIGLGLSMSFVTIVLPEVMDAKEGLSITKKQASWFGTPYRCRYYVGRRNA